MTQTQSAPSKKRVWSPFTLGWATIQFAHSTPLPVSGSFRAGASLESVNGTTLRELISLIWRCWISPFRTWAQSHRGTKARVGVIGARKNPKIEGFTLYTPPIHSGTITPMNPAKPRIPVRSIKFAVFDCNGTPIHVGDKLKWQATAGPYGQTKMGSGKVTSAALVCGSIVTDGGLVSCEWEWKPKDGPEGLYCRRENHSYDHGHKTWARIVETA